MRILHLGKHYPPHHGGMETVLQNIVEGLLDAGDEVFVLAAGTDAGEHRDIVKGSRTNRPGTLVRLANIGTLDSQPLTLDVIHSLRIAVAQFRPDIIHLHLPNPLVAAAWLAWQCLEPGPKPALAVWHHADIANRRFGRHMVRPFVDACLKRAHGICVSSQALASSSVALRNVQPKVRVIPFGIADAPSAPIVDDGPGPFLFVGRLVPYKGLMVLFEALVRVPGAELDIIGRGPQEKELRRSVQALGLGGRVRFQGDVSTHDLHGFLGRARALVLPSVDDRETFGLVQLEAMAAGVPVIATDLSTGVAEVGLAGETGLLVPAGDSLALSDALSRLQSNASVARTMGKSGRRRYLAHFTRQRMIADLRLWYQNLLTRSGRVGS